MHPELKIAIKRQHASGKELSFQLGGWKYIGIASGTGTKPIYNWF